MLLLSLSFPRAPRGDNDDAAAAAAARELQTMHESSMTYPILYVTGHG